MNDLKRLHEFLSTPRKIVITTHHKPDGDALGSSLALYHYFQKKTGHVVNVISPTDYPDFLEWLPGNDQVINFEKNRNKSLELVSEADIFFCLDFNKLYRINELGEHIGSSNSPKVLIDHHLEKDDFATYNFWNTKACSTAELVYQFIMDSNDESLIDEVVATCIYTGILTDTNGFRVPTTSPYIHRVAAHLMEMGVNHTDIYSRIYETFSENRLRLFGFSITERMSVHPDLNAGIITLDANDLRKFNIKTGDTEGLVNFPLKIDSVQMAALIIQRPDQVKLSFRSKGDWDVNALSKEHFEGGGHKNAAGGKSSLNVEETKLKLIAILAALKK